MCKRRTLELGCFGEEKNGNVADTRNGHILSFDLKLVDLFCYVCAPVIPLCTHEVVHV